MKKIFKTILKCFIALIIFLLIFLSVHLFDWQGRYVYNHDFITIMGREYFFEPVFFQHTEREFRNVSAGITYDELVKKFGPENGQLNSNGIKNSIYYALTVDRFVVFQLVPFYTYENGEKTENLIVWRIDICDDKEILEVISEDNGIYEAAVQTWEIDIGGDIAKTN